NQTNSEGHIFAKPKDPVEKNQKTHAIYSIPCDKGKSALGEHVTSSLGILLHFNMVPGKRQCHTLRIRSAHNKPIFGICRKRLTIIVVKVHVPPKETRTLQVWRTRKTPQSPCKNRENRATVNTEKTMILILIQNTEFYWTTTMHRSDSKIFLAAISPKNVGERGRDDLYFCPPSSFIPGYLKLAFIRTLDEDTVRKLAIRSLRRGIRILKIRLLTGVYMCKGNLILIIYILIYVPMYILWQKSVFSFWLMNHFSLNPRRRGGGVGSVLIIRHTMSYTNEALKNVQYLPTSRLSGDQSVIFEEIIPEPAVRIAVRGKNLKILSAKFKKYRVVMATLEREPAFSAVYVLNPSDRVAQLLERQSSNLKVAGSRPNRGRRHLSACAGFVNIVNSKLRSLNRFNELSFFKTSGREFHTFAPDRLMPIATFLRPIYTTSVLGTPKSGHPYLCLLACKRDKIGTEPIDISLRESVRSPTSLFSSAVEVQKKHMLRMILSKAFFKSKNKTPLIILLSILNELLSKSNIPLKIKHKNHDREGTFHKLAIDNIRVRACSISDIQSLAFCSSPVYVIIEYVSRGDLLGFLRKTRGLVDTTYDVPNHIPQSHLSQCQLLRMACNVAMGMAHLSRNQVIHRDLAARNVLVGENLECKITDFGMARDVKATNYYRKRSRGRIPLKWTAIEALVDDKYTIESDVWSFGILLYEIVTMGGKPYPGMGAGQVLRKLKSGWRMSRPAHVDTSLYEIMLKCWCSSPDDRPSFSILAKTFTDFIIAKSGPIINCTKI
ncbi:tyrosine- kinase receptor Tie-1-like isoform X2, partial [Paramuricea clavata]